jgi:hypothetical protein
MREFQPDLVDHHFLEVRKRDVWVAGLARRKKSLERVV